MTPPSFHKSEPPPIPSKDLDSLLGTPQKKTSHPSMLATPRREMPNPPNVSPSFLKLSAEERKRLDTEDFEYYFRAATEASLDIMTSRISFASYGIYYYNGDLDNELGKLGHLAARVESTADALGIPASVREHMIKGFYRQYFYQTTAHLERKIKNLMLESAIDPEGIFTFGKDGIQLRWKGKTVDLDALEECARLAGISPQDIAKEVKRFEHELRKANALLMAADAAEGLINYANYTSALYPCRPELSVEHSPTFRCRSWKQIADPQALLTDLGEDLIEPLTRGISRYIYSL